MLESNKEVFESIANTIKPFLLESPDMPDNGIYFNKYFLSEDTLNISASGKGFGFGIDLEEEMEISLPKGLFDINNIQVLFDFEPFTELVNSIHISKEGR